MVSCPYKAGDKIEGKEATKGIIGLLSKEVWHPATVEKVEGNLMLISSPIFGDKKVWLEYQLDWFREVKEEVK